MTNNKTQVGILGAGISGLSIAYALEQEGVSVTIYEKNKTPGGAMRSVKKEGWLVEEGPNTLLVKSQKIWELLEKLGLKNKTVRAKQAARKRYVVKNSELAALPDSATTFLTTPVFSAGAKLRLLKEPFVVPSEAADETIASFIERRLGKQLLDYGVNPFVSGIYAGDPKALSVKHTFSSLWEMEQHHGSLLKGVWKRDKKKAAPRALLSFSDGVQTLPRALAKKLAVPVQVSTEVTSATRKGSRWHVSGFSKGREFHNSHQCLVSTLPAYILGDVFEPQFFKELVELPYAPLSMLALGFKQQQIQHPLDGFGVLIPETEGYKTLGALFSSTLFPERTPADHQLLTCFIGGARDPVTAALPSEELQEMVLQELRPLLDISGPPVFSHHRFWPKAIPQYNLGHDRYLSLIERLEAQNAGLFIEGNFRGGVSVPDCITSGLSAARKVHGYLQKHR